MIIILVKAGKFLPVIKKNWLLFCDINGINVEVKCHTNRGITLFVLLQQVPVANGTSNPSGSTKCDVKLELAFEYLMSKDRLQWVTITSQQVKKKKLELLAPFLEKVRPPAAAHNVSLCDPRPS